ncbi:hypothetical protein XHV734_4760 [Xanthomonas hortorum pv. vitians]|nr:hypothetical protein XHV734_4760 [Xanthomonas hortorum pv. vitians]
MGGQGPVESVGVHGFKKEATDQLSGAVSSPIAGPCGGMDAATEPPGMDSRRVPRAVRAPRPRPGFGSGEFLPSLGSDQARQACGTA